MLRRWPNAPGAGSWAIALLLGALVAAAPVVNATGHPPRSAFLILPEATPPPRIDMDVEALGGGRYLLILHVSAFVFTALCVADADAVPVGHAHVHVNGVKVASAYAPIIEIGPLTPGTHDVDVVLRGQDHRAIVARGGLVQHRVRITVGSGPA